MKGKVRVLVGLHLLLLVFSASSVCSKLASGYEFLSAGFILCYGMVIFLLGVYAIFWQQIIKRLPLTVAFANKAVTVVWGIVWGTVIFHESVTWGKIAGSVLVIAGVVLYLSGDRENADQKDGGKDDGEAVRETMRGSAEKEAAK